MARRFSLALVAAAILSMPCSSEAADPHKQLLARYVVPDAPAIGSVAATTVIHLAIGLAPKDPEGLRAFADAVSDPKNPQFRQFLTLEQLTEKFGPSAADHQALIAWAQSNRLSVESQYPHRLLLGVEGEVADVELAFAVKLVLAKRPDGSTFYKPDRVPSLDLDVKISHVAGIDNLFVPRHRGGSQPGGNYGSSDLRNAYAGSCLGLTGAGQSVGILAYGGYRHTDVAAYEATVGIANTAACGASVPGSPPCLSDVLVSGSTGPISDETTADVELAIAMAPGLKQVKVFEANPMGGCVFGDHAIAAMAASTDVLQFSSSVSFCPSDNISTFNLMAGQGQSFFASSGDSGTAYFTAVAESKVTVVGGTTLSMNGNGASWQSEQAWYYSGGGVEVPVATAADCPANCTPASPGCQSYCIPPWQQGVANASNGASSISRNEPDLAMPAQGVFLIWNGMNSSFCGTSASAPLMAGFMALVNQQQCINSPAGCAHGVGFVNPLLYAVGMNGAVYAKSFHDIVANSTDNATCHFPGHSAPAVSGYDLATGLGSPKCGLVDQLSCATCNGATAVAGTPPSLSCVSFQSDANNCGFCGNVCAAGSACMKGHCQAGHSIGETHLRTFDGLFYDFQASGDFVLAESGPGFVVQTRQAVWPRRPYTAVNKAVATRMGTTSVALCIEPTRLLVNGSQRMLRDGKSLSLPGAVKVSRSGDVYVISNRRGETVQAELYSGWINVSVGLGDAPPATVRGLLGNINGKTEDDIATAGGTVLAQPVWFRDFYRDYTDGWRVRRSQSLLSGCPKTTSGIPDRMFYARDLDPEEHEYARAVCAAAGVRGETLVEACKLDVGVLKDKAAATVFVRTPPPAAVMLPRPNR
jgi:Pro-kumamolisin, activation domain/von Willebrand factor type D domain